MKSFAFIVSPTTTKQFKSFWPSYKLIPDFILRPYLQNSKPFQAFHIRKIVSPQGKQIQAYIIACPLLPKQLPLPDSDYALEQIIYACQLAQKLDAKLIGIDGFAAKVVNKNFSEITKRVLIPVTCGNALTAWSMYEAVFRVAKLKKIDLKKSCVTVIDALNATGRLCAKRIAGYVPKIILNAQNLTKLERLKEAITEESKTKAVIDFNINSAVAESNIVINPDGQLDHNFDLSSLKKGAIFCYNLNSDSSFDKTTLKKSIEMVGAGTMHVPFLKRVGFNTRLPGNILSAAFTETLLLALEGKFISYSLGENINPDRMEEIADLAARYGVEVWVPGAPVL